MKSTIKQLIRVHPPVAKGASAEITFPVDFIGFRGHFDDQPVLPGVCLVLTVLILAENMEGTALNMQEIVSAKFFSPVPPDFPVRVNCSIADRIVRAKLAGDTGRIAEVKIKVDHA